MKVAISFLVISVPITLCSAAFGQISSSSRFDQNGNYTLTATVNSGFPGTTAIMAGAPYSGEEVAQTTQILADGTRVTRPQASVRMWRDSAGRTRTERPFMPIATGAFTLEAMPYLTEIFDPVAGYRFYLDSTNRVAHRCKLAGNLTTIQLQLRSSSSVGSRIMNAKRIGADNPEITTESLGTKAIEGISAEGLRTTTVYPVGAMGNDRPIVTTSETWYSYDLGVMLFSKNADPRSGETIHGLINTSRAEPDPSLFQVPQDYRLIDEDGSFTITITGHK